MVNLHELPPEVRKYAEEISERREENALWEYEVKMARLLQMMDSWDEDFPTMINRSVVTASLRMVIRGAI